MCLDGNLTIRTIAVVHATLHQALAEQQDVEIDCSAAENVDLSFIQLLLSARLTAQQAGKRLVICTPLPAVLHAALDHGGFLSPTGENAFWSDDK